MNMGGLEASHRNWKLWKGAKNGADRNHEEEGKEQNGENEKENEQCPSPTGARGSEDEGIREKSTLKKFVEFGRIILVLKGRELRKGGYTQPEVVLTLLKTWWE